LLLPVVEREQQKARSRGVRVSGLVLNPVVRSAYFAAPDTAPNTLSAW